jgi:hypothetical protein
MGREKQEELETPEAPGNLRHQKPLLMMTNMSF